MSEQVFKSPGFFEREIEIQSKPPQKEPNSSPVGIIGPAEKGPAFVPVILNSMDDYKKVFGDIQKDKLAGHAVAEFFTSKGGANAEASIQFIRTLGLGATPDSPTQYLNEGVSPSAGFVCKVSAGFGGVQLLTADHKITTNEKFASGMFSLHGTVSEKKLVRAMFFLHKKCKLTLGTVPSDVASVEASKEFIINVDCSDSSIKERSVKVSLDPDKSNYIAKVLNTDPFAINEYGYLLYLHFPIDSDFCDLDTAANKKIALLRGKTDDYGMFNTRFNSPKTSKFISQPFGSKEYELFHFESIDDGSYAAGKYKISISNLRASTDINYKFGTFNIELRDLNDTDENPNVIESYANCSLDPSSSNYVAKLIGDQKTFYNIDVENSDERRLYTNGENPNQSTRIRIVMSDDVINNEIPDEALPFGFRAIPVLKTDSSLLNDATGNPGLNAAVLPPLPYRFKITAGIRDYSLTDYLGQASSGESVNTGAYWGLMNFNIDSINTPNSRATSGDVINRIVENYSKFMGIPEKATTYDANSVEADEFNNNKFTLARVALATQYSTTAVSNLSSSVTTTFKEAIYVRNGNYSNSNYTITSDYDQGNPGNGLEKDNRITLATILSENKEKFNKYSVIAKFTTPMFGGFDGLNIFDKDSMNMNDRASSTEIDDFNNIPVNGKASDDGFDSALSGTSVAPLMQGTGFNNNIIASYTSALDQMLEVATASVHILVLPGIREPLITNYAASKVEEYGKAIYLMDLPHYDKNGVRLYDEKVDAGKKADVTTTISKLGSRNFDNSYVASYFPDVMLEDASDPVVGAIVKRTLKCPSSIVALGALAKSEGGQKLIQPWFAPAGFQYGLNDRIKGVNVRLRAEDRDDLYEARINPIATFPSNQYVIFGQKTLQVANTALSRVNVRRLMIEIKRGVERYAQKLLFEPNSAIIKNEFSLKINALLANIQKNSGIENFRVTISDEELDGNSVKGRIIIVPTRVVEFIAMDFVITNSGVSFA